MNMINDMNEWINEYVGELIRMKGWMSEYE